MCMLGHSWLLWKWSCLQKQASREEEESRKSVKKKNQKKKSFHSSHIHCNLLISLRQTARHSTAQPVTHLTFCLQPFKSSPLAKSRNSSKAFTASFYKKRSGRCQRTAVLIRDAWNVSQHPRGVPSKQLQLLVLRRVPGAPHLQSHRRLSCRVSARPTRAWCHKRLSHSWLLQLHLSKPSQGAHRLVDNHLVHAAQRGTVRTHSLAPARNDNCGREQQDDSWCGFVLKAHRPRAGGPSHHFLFNETGKVNSSWTKCSFPCSPRLDVIRDRS